MVVPSGKAGRAPLRVRRRTPYSELLEILDDKVSGITALCVSQHLPTPPHTSTHLPTSPHISPHLPISPPR